MLDFAAPGAPGGDDGSKVRALEVAAPITPGRNAGSGVRVSDLAAPNTPRGVTGQGLGASDLVLKICHVETERHNSDVVYRCSHLNSIMLVDYYN